jgi:hyperosmotically inducible periplasmic protein
MDGFVHSAFQRAFWLGVAAVTPDRDYSAPISLPTTDTRRRISAIDVLGVTLVLVVSTVSAQDGILSRTGQALDNVGRGIRNAVDTGVAQGQIDAEDREVLARVMRRVEWDKHLVGSMIQIEVQPRGKVLVRGSLASPIHKKRAAELVASTVGVGSGIDQLAVVREVKVIKATPAARC